MMEQDVEILRYNLDQPLTDQLVKHSRCAPLENSPWGREKGDGQQTGHWDSDKQKYPTSNGYNASSSSSSFEIMDLAMRKKPGSGGGDVGSAARLNSERDNKRAFGCDATDKTGASGAATYNHSAVQSSDFDRFYKGSPPVDYIPNGNGVKDLHKSDAAIRNHGGSLSRGTAKCSPMPALTTKAELSAQSGLPPPLLRTGYDGGHAGAKMSAFQPVESHMRDQTVPALYKSHPYPYGLPTMPPNTTGLFDYPSLSHHLLQPSDHHRSLIPAPSSSQAVVSAGSALSPYVLYSDNLMTHQLEVMYQRKYPNHPVPPVWMLYQFMDELLRDTSRVPTRDMNPIPPPSRVDSTSYKVTSMSSSVPSAPVVGSGAMPTERKKMKKDQRERERFGENKEAKAGDGRNKEAFQSKQRNDGRDRKEWGKAEMERREAPQPQNGNAMDWHHHHQLRQSQLDAHLHHQQQQQQQQQRRELLVDESASSACDAVDQHFQESLLRLASSQNHVNTTSPREAATGIIGQSVLSRNHLDEQIIIEKQENNLHGNGNHGSWKDGRYAKPAVDHHLHHQYRASDDGNSFSRLLGAGATTQIASRNNNNNNNKATAADCVSFDLYGYQPHQTRDYNPERFHGAARGDMGSNKLEKPGDSRLQAYGSSSRQSMPNSSELMASGKKQPAFLAAEPGKDARDAHQDLRNSFNASAKGGGAEKPTSRAVASAKLLNGVNLSTGGQSVSSPIPGSIVKDSRLGPSRLIARSPKPLPSVFGNPLDSGFEPVQQVSIEPVERWTGSGGGGGSTWAPSSSSKVVTDGYRSGGYYMHPGFQQTGFPTPTETYSKIQQGLIPNPLYFPGMYEMKQGGGYAGLPHRSSVPDFHQPLVRTSPSESRVMPGKPGKKEEESVKKTTRGNSVPRLSSFGSGGDDSGGPPRARIDSFKSFVEQAVYNAFIEDTDEGNGSEKISSMTRLIEDLEKERDARDALAAEGKNIILTGSSSSASKLSSQPSPMSDKSAAEATSLPGDLSKTGSDQPASLTAKVLSGDVPSAMDWCNGEPSRGTCSTASSITAASDLPDTGSIVAMDTRPPSAHPSQITPSPPSFSLPPSPPRASASSLHLKKAWLLRYSDNDQKPLSDASSSSFRDELDNQSSDCSKCSFTEKSSQSPCESDLVIDVAKYVEIQPDVVSKVERDGKNASSCCASEDDAQENGNDAAKLKGLKRKAASEAGRARCAKRARDSAAGSPGRNNKSELLNGHQDNRKTRSKYSTRLAKMTERSAPSSPRVTSHDREQRDDPKNTEDNDDSCSPVQSDSEAKTSRLRKKNKVNNDHKDAPDGRSTVQSKKTNPSSRIFLQDAACAEVDQRLTKCRECKAPQSQKNNPNTTNICKFYVFRKLQCYSKGSVSVAGFSEPSDAEEGDIDLWMPLQSKNSHLTSVQARYAIDHLKEYFLFLLEHETNSDRHKSNESDKNSDVRKIFWRRPIEGVQETCDICDAVVFDVHWTCARCGFVVCIDCNEGYGSRKDAEDGHRMDDDDDNDDDENDWPTCCASRRSHHPDDLTMTRVIPCDVLTVMKQKLHQLLDAESDVKSEISSEVQPKTEISEDLPTQSATNSASIPATSVCAENATAESGVPRPSVPSGDSAEEQKPVVDAAAGALEGALGCLSDAGRNGVSPDPRETRDNGKLSSVPRVVLSRSDVDMNRSNKSIESKDPSPCQPRLHGDDATATRRGSSQRVLHLVDDSDEGAVDRFQRHWKQSFPVVVSSGSRRFRPELWRPEAFAKRFPHLKVDLTSGLTGAVHRFQSMEKFWTGSKYLLPSSTSRTTGLLQFKDWPLTDDWTGLLNDLHVDLGQALPFHSYTTAAGSFNLASHLPEFFPQPDLVTRIVVGHGNVALNQATLARLQMNPVDFVNVVMHAESRDSSSESFASNIVKLLKDCGVDSNMTLVSKKPEAIVAVWHIYLPQDTSKIRSFLEKIHTGRASSPKGGSRDSSTDVGCYLDSTLQEKLLKDFGVEASVIVQCLGDAVFVPAMSFHQVKVIQDCISVSREFISPESIQSSFDKSLQLKWSHSQNKGKHDRQNHLQIKNLVYHTVKDCIATLSDAKS